MERDGGAATAVADGYRAVDGAGASAVVGGGDASRTGQYVRIHYAVAVTDGS